MREVVAQTAERMTGGRENLHSFLTPASGVAWAKMAAQLTAVAALFLLLAVARWASEPWYWWWIPSGVLALATVLIIVRRRWLLRRGRANEWQIWDCVILGAQQASGLLIVLGLWFSVAFHK